ncbi:MAG: DUF6514 family protein [Defluviitaleaceae bacterium]|nr:DUF6514 family protein [Defluviitaleaceae bacterium]MCL2239828.1 DUF6514 family protein [Defluviitaleaceae bacterium]
MRTNEQICEVTIRHEDGTEWVLVYYVQVISSRDDGELYALRVDKLATDGKVLEREQTCALTDSRLEAVEMAKAFAKGTVPPSVLVEMADEWITELTVNMPAHTYHRAG